MQALRKNAKQFIIRSGLGRFRPYVDAISAYSKYGDWLKQNSSVRMFRERETMYDFLNTEIVCDEPVDYLEFGVYQGYTVKYWSTINANPDSRFFGFDSFEGLPEDWSGAFVRVPKGTFNTEGMIPQIDDPRVSFNKGWFQDSLPLFLETFDSRNRLLIHCDADLYTSTLFVLCTLHNRLKPGSLIVFDEFSARPTNFALSRITPRHFCGNSGWWPRSAPSAIRLRSRSFDRPWYHLLVESLGSHLPACALGSSSRLPTTMSHLR